MSKLSLQILLHETDNLDICRKIAAARPRLVKVVNSLNHLKELRRLLPDAVLIGRMLRGEDAMEGIDPEKVAPEGAARCWFDVMAAIMRSAPDVFYEGGYNEWGDWPHLGWYGAYEAERQRLMAAAGLRACIGNFSAHANLYDKWTPFQPAMDAAVTLGNLLGLHGYNSPSLDSGDVEDWLFSYRRLARAAGDHLPYVALTEFGIDRIPGVNQYDGWRTVPGITPEGYAAQLAWADAEMGRDPYVVGACVYLWTMMEFGDYIQYNIAKPGRREHVAVVDLMLAHIAANPDTSPPAPLPPGEGRNTNIDGGGEGRNTNEDVGAVVEPRGEAEPPGIPYRAVLTEALNARIGPVDSSPRIATLRPGTEVTVLDAPVDGEPSARRARIEVTVLRKYLKRV